MISRRVFTVAACWVSFATIGGVALFTDAARQYVKDLWQRLRGRRTLEERLSIYSSIVDYRLRSRFVEAGLSYPPGEVAYLVFKDARRLDVYSRSAANSSWQFVMSYPVLGLSGNLGPKLAEGDGQVPEGIYFSESLNPNSRFHLSIRLNYPNASDQERARVDGRSRLGGDIMIHGATASIGCLAMGNPAIEDLFVLAAIVECKPVRIIVSPTDFRQSSMPITANQPNGIGELYAELKDELKHFPKPN